MTAPSPGVTHDIAATRQRLDEALSFLAHDARDGYATTIALMELQRVRTSPLPSAELLERIERNAQRALQAIDDYVEVAHARDRALRHEPLDLADELVDAFANAWPAADARGVKLNVGGASSAPGSGDRVLLRGALGKLVRDAVADAVDGSEVDGVLLGDGDRWVVEVRLQPRGDVEPVPGAASRRPRVAGLALATVVGERHAGAMSSRLDPDGKRLLRLELPKGAETENAANG